jgi:hypothetical protein
MPLWRPPDRYGHASAGPPSAGRTAETEKEARMTRSMLPRCCLPMLAVIALWTVPGCQIAAIIGGGIENYKQDSTHEIKAEYTGLEGKSFAVVVAADRMIQSEQPDLVRYLTVKMTERLANNTNVPRAGGFVPAEDVLRYLYANPGWNSKPMSDLAKALGGVERLVYVEVFEYQLHEPGNQYEWDGTASGTVGVVETDSALPDDFAFQRQVAVKFPDKKGMGPGDMTASAVTTVLSSRFIDRVTWLMYNHQEKYYPDY